MARTQRAAYTKSKAVDATCRNHGSCPWCARNRAHADALARRIADEKIVEYETIVTVV